jgi:hypothetical protein
LTSFVEQLQDEYGGDLTKFKVPELKQVLKQIGQSVSGKKADLIASLEAYLVEHDLIGGGGKKKKKVKKEDEDAMDVDGGGEEEEEQPRKRRKKAAAVDDSE